ncbi:MAG: ATP-binding protein [Rhodocyclaceae bacterium]|nr:ATP-binding protein [Rhodocyclaceae bacterium]
MKGTLIFFCGKMGAGKSTRAGAMAGELEAVLLSEDEWLSRLYPDEIRVFDDYLKYSARIRPLVESLLRAFVDAGVSVVLDFPGNTVGQRAWFRTLIRQTGAAHRLIYCEAGDELCLGRLALRRQRQPERARFDNEAVFRQVTKYFEPPGDDEGFHVEVVGE